MKLTIVILAELLFFGLTQGKRQFLVEVAGNTSLHEVEEQNGSKESIILSLFREARACQKNMVIQSLFSVIFAADPNINIDMCFWRQEAYIMGRLIMKKM